jgi:hypothetical protein
MNNINCEPTKFDFAVLILVLFGIIGHGILILYNGYLLVT